jgi:uncharacterized protein YecE (DUF72 family)
MAFDLATYRQRLAALAAQGVYLGTSSWKYEGWRGLVYDEQRYLTRGKFSEAKFERECLAEYAATFPTVCVDAGYYQFPTEKYLAGLAAQVPGGFQFAFKATDEVTIKTFPNLPRFGQRAGRPNENFLNADLFRRLFLTPCEGYREKIGPIIFEFSTFHKGEYEHGRDFVAALDRFLGELPRGWRYAVELRNKTWLQPEYFAMLRSHNVAHVYNSWTRMPSVPEQLAMPESETADFTVSRLLLRPGRTYEAAVKAFQPYKAIQDEYTELRHSVKEMIERLCRKARKGWVYINNRLEGCAVISIDAITEMLLHYMRLSAPPPAPLPSSPQRDLF